MTAISRPGAAEALNAGTLAARSLRVAPRRQRPRHLLRARRAAAAIVTGDLSVVVLATPAATLAVPPRDVFWLFLALGLPAVAAAGGRYGPRTMVSGSYGRRSVLTAAAVVGVAALLLAQATGQLPPVALTGLVAATTVGMLAVRHLTAREMRRRRAADPDRALVIGSDAALGAVLGRADATTAWRILGRVRRDDDGAEVPGVTDLGRLTEVRQLVADHDVDVVLAAGLTAAETAELLDVLGPTPAELVLVPGVSEVRHARLQPMREHGRWDLFLRVEPRPNRLVGKDLFDRVAAALLLVPAGVVIGLAAAAIRLTSKGPAFYSQVRIGRDGRPFTMWKLRTMIVGADRQVAALDAANEADGAMFKIRRDPRITPVGGVLRRLSVDELPQLWNVLCGDMSLIGPRPPLPHEVAQYSEVEFGRLAVKPGLTGLWQVSGRSDLTWDRTVQLDLRYIDNRCWPMEVRILAATAGAVLGGRGAY